MFDNVMSDMESKGHTFGTLYCLDACGAYGANAKKFSYPSNLASYASQKAQLPWSNRRLSHITCGIFENITGM